MNPIKFVKDRIDNRTINEMAVVIILSLVFISIFLPFVTYKKGFETGTRNVACRFELPTSNFWKTFPVDIADKKMCAQIRNYIESGELGNVYNGTKSDEEIASDLEITNMGNIFVNEEIIKERMHME